MRYEPLRDDVQQLIDHLSDAKRKPSAALVKRTADRLAMMMLESGPVLQILGSPKDIDLRMRTLRHLMELERIIARKCLHGNDSHEL